jgi:hypothetical protein
MLIACSPDKNPGSAKRIINQFKSHNINSVTVYHGKSYNLDNTYKHALDCSADIAMVGGITNHSLIYLLGVSIISKQRFSPTPSIQHYQYMLMTTCDGSPFWEMQNFPVLIEDI